MSALSIYLIIKKTKQKGIIYETKKKQKMAVVLEGLVVAAGAGAMAEQAVVIVDIYMNPSDILLPYLLAMPLK